MEHLNAEQREKLARELATLKFNQAKWRLLKMDPKGRITFFRNTQRIGYLQTRFALPSYGASVTLVETHGTKTDPITSKIMAQNSLVEVIVEPTPDNHT